MEMMKKAMQYFTSTEQMGTHAIHTDYWWTFMSVMLLWMQHANVWKDSPLAPSIKGVEV